MKFYISSKCFKPPSPAFFSILEWNISQWKIKWLFSYQQCIVFMPFTLQFLALSRITLCHAVIPIIERNKRGFHSYFIYMSYKSYYCNFFMLNPGYYQHSKNSPFLKRKMYRSIFDSFILENRFISIALLESCIIKMTKANVLDI